MTISWGNANPVPEEKEAVILNPRDVVHRRLLVRPIEYIESMLTKARTEPTDAIKMDIVVLDEPSGPARFNGALWYNGNLIGLFKKQLGMPFIGFISQEQVPGTAWKKFIWNPLDEDGATRSAAESWIHGNPDFLGPLPEPRKFERQSDPQAHHEQGPPPLWAGVNASPGSSLPPFPPSAPAWTPPALQAPAPTYPPVSASPALTGAQETMIERLKRQAGMVGAPQDQGEAPF